MFLVALVVIVVVIIIVVIEIYCIYNVNNVIIHESLININCVVKFLKGEHCIMMVPIW